MSLDNNIPYLSAEIKVMEMNLKKNVSWMPNKTNKIHVTEMKPATPVVTFQECVRSSLISGQMFSLLPVDGIAGKRPNRVKFKYKSWKCVYSALSLCGQLFMTFMCIYKVLYSNSSLKSTTSVIFYGTTCITMIMFFQMARSWPKLVLHVAKNEEIDTNYDPKLLFKCNVTCVVILGLSLFEHILSLLFAFASGRQCYPDMPIYEGFVRHSYSWVFDYLPYTWLAGFIAQFLHFEATFIWNYSDLFVIVMSYFLTSRLDQVNKKLLDAQGKYLPEPFWRSIREEYGRVTQLVRRVDGVIGGIVFMCFANNLFFICFQLFNTLENGLKGNSDCPKMASNTGSYLLGGYEAAAYFIFSLVYLIMRSVTVSLIAAQVNTASTVPAPVLYDVPSPVYCTEVQRFLDQVNGEKVALTGLQFFSVTRGLLLTVAGTIVTYELVMVQFNSPSPSVPIPTTTDPTVFLDNFTTTAAT